MSEKEKILSRLIDIGLIDEKVKEDLSLSFSDFLKKEADNEVEMLSEVIRIKNKKDNGTPLTSIEEMFFNYFKKNYSY